MNNYRIVPRGQRWARVVITIIVVIIFLGVGGAFLARHVYNENLKPVASSQKSISFTIPRGASLGEVASLLKKSNLIRNELAFRQYVLNKRASNDIKAGTYDLSPSYSLPEIVAIITEGKVKTNLITILPGQRLDQIHKAFITSGFSAEAVNKALDPARYQGHPALVEKPAGASLEGYLYPESFQVTADTTPENIIGLSLDEMQKRLTPDIRAAIASQGLSVYQGIVLASMAEKEADKPTDRQLIIGVFLNRLRQGMKLESDATAFYGAAINNQPLSLSYDTPYNTYLHTGLPQGPISNVTAASIKAVAYPTPSEFLYFVAGDDDVVYFSKTLQEHQAKVNQYCQKKCPTVGQ